MKTIVSLLSLACLPVFAAPQSDKQNTPLVQRVQLEKYLTDLTPEETLEKLDSQNKGEPDMFVVFRREEGVSNRQLVLQAFDVNRDKKIDLVKHFSKGKVIKREADLDFDGIVDVISEFDPVSGQLRKKTQADGPTNVWKYYVSGELRRKEMDRNADGKPDMWVYYRGGRATRTEIDQNFDGKPIAIEGTLAPAKNKKTGVQLKDKILTE
ncbi:MAG: hypothetical protein IT289_10680 [Oligoflexia bacterium]|nr:hypothetical protein [Oligoflexia bacterium]